MYISASSISFQVKLESQVSWVEEFVFMVSTTSIKQYRIAHKYNMNT